MHSASRNPVKKVGSAVPAGSVTDEQFRKAFTTVPPFQFASSKDLLSECQRLSAILANTNIDWDKRSKALQQVRSLLVAGAGENNDFLGQGLSLLEQPFLESVKDLRSQVCREACITVAFYAEQLGSKFWRVCEPLMPTLMNLMQNSAKVMATSAINANRYIARHIKNPKVLAIFQQYLSTSKSREIRRYAMEMFLDVLNNWEPALIEKNMSAFEQAIRTGVYDADPQARDNAKRAFQLLQTSFPKSAEFLLQSLEPMKQRVLLGGITSAASSSQSINSERDTVPHARFGLYSQQNAFYANRSTSDLNPSVMKKLNLTSSAARQGRVNPMIANRKPPAASPLMKTPPAKTPSFPAPKKPLPTVAASASKSSSSKSISQPNSRSTSPGRMRTKSRIPAPAEATKAHRDPSPRASAMQRAPQSAHQNFTQRDLAKALKNVDISRRVVPNVVRHDTTASFTTPQKPRPVANGGIRAHAGVPPPDAVFGTASPAHPQLVQRPNGAGRHSEATNGTQFNNNERLDVTSPESRWCYESAHALATDVIRQDAIIRDICDVLSGETGGQINEEEVDKALNALSRMIRDDAVTQWDEHFSSIMFNVLQAVDKEGFSKNTKQSALKALKCLIVSQHHRMIGKQELITLKVLNAHNSTDSLLVRAAEDCAGSLAAHLPKQASIKSLLSVMESDSSPPWKIAGAIKMLSRVFENLSDEEVKSQLPVIIPRLMKCYESTESIVRRACVICLVAMSDNIGMEPLRPFLSVPTLKLVDVYRQRMENNQK